MSSDRARSQLYYAGTFALLGLAVAVSLWLFVLPPGFDIALPIGYGDGDSLQSAAYVKRLLETHWFPFHTNLLGAPFGAADFDYPEAEAANYLIFAVLGIFSRDWVVVTNVFIFATFVLAAVSSFAFFQSLGVQPALAFAGSLLFAFLPYHFLRLVPLGHLLLASYWNVPIATWVALRCWSPELRTSKPPHRRVLRASASVLALVAVATGGIYYAFFGCYLILAAALASALAQRSYRAAIPGAVAIAAICVVVLAELLPSLGFHWTNGANAEAAVRAAGESEIYGLKPMQLAIPQPNHPLSALRDIANRYARASPLVNENQAASLGLFGTVGLIVLCIAVLGRLTRGSGAATTMDRLALLAGAAIALGAIGGLGAVFSMTFSAMIRAYNRISIFVGLLAIAALLLALDAALRRISDDRPVLKIASWIGIAAVLVLGLWDQASKFDQRRFAAAFANDRRFFADMEAALPAHTSVYQLPYRPYPEAGALYDMKDYDHFRGYLHTVTTRWSYGGMKGREGDRWLQSLSQRPVAEQLSEAARAGFGAVYLDRRAYADGGAAVEAILRQSLGAPIATSADGRLVVFRLAPA